MKIQDSRFYHPKRFLVANEGDGDRVSIDHETYAATWNPYQTVLSESLAGVSLRNSHNAMVIHQAQLRHFEKCTDFVSLTYSPTLNRLYESVQCYFHPETDVFILITPNLTTSYNEELFEDGIFRVENLYYDAHQSDALMRVQALMDRYFEQYTGNPNKVLLLVREKDELKLNAHDIKPYPVDLEAMYNDDFLPVHQHILDKLHNDHKGVVLLHGLSGTGKTNYIKWLTAQVVEKPFIFIPSALMQSLTSPNFIPFLIKNKNSVLVLEDCENYISERDASGGNSDAVASILNLADGILSDIVECQMICTFNAPIERIDRALLRQGRLIAEYRFDKLSAEKVNHYLQATLDNVDSRGAMTLAEMMHFQETEHKVPPEKKRPMGFL